MMWSTSLALAVKHCAHNGSSAKTMVRSRRHVAPYPRADECGRCSLGFRQGFHLRVVAVALVLAPDRIVAIEYCGVLIGYSDQMSRMVAEI
jgi:hypothetical protein